MRTISTLVGCAITEMKNQQKRTLCCGEGGSASFVAPEITGQWAEKREQQAEGKPVITYCAGCVHFFSGRFQTIHIVDLLLEPERALAGQTKISRSPWTYLNRLKLKLQLRR